jgi:hypothetical protein
MSSTYRHLLLDFFWQVISRPPVLLIDTNKLESGLIWITKKKKHCSKEYFICIFISLLTLRKIGKIRLDNYTVASVPTSCTFYDFVHLLTLPHDWIKCSALFIYH